MRIIFSHTIQIWRQTHHGVYQKRLPFVPIQGNKKHTVYKTINDSHRIIFYCTNCDRYFSQTCNTFLAGIKKPLSLVVQVLKARTEGLGLNAACRTFDVAKNTLLNWEGRFAGIKQMLLLYSLLHVYLQLIIEGDEVYTRVRKNAPPEESLGWTVVLMDRASRFLWELRCGRKDRNLFKKAMRTLERLINNTQDLTLITDGERRYGNVLFDICHELIHNGKKGRPRKTFKKGVKVRLKNKGSQSHKRGPKRPKYQTPHPEHPNTLQKIHNEDIQANHCEAFNSSLRRKNSTFRRRSNTYAKSETGLQRTLDVYWVVHNFLRPHFTTKQVPSVALGILDKEFSWKEILALPVAA